MPFQQQEVDDDRFQRDQAREDCRSGDRRGQRIERDEVFAVDRDAHGDRVRRQEELA